MQFKFTTAGESHGKALVAIVEGVPAGLDIDVGLIDKELWRRQQGYGRGGRMKIETDTVEILSGVRHGRAIGSPIALMIANDDFCHWREVMASIPLSHRPRNARKLTRPRPGHADLAGGQKYGALDLRDILERASARETAARVACGAIAKQILAEFGVEIKSHVIKLGSIDAGDAKWDDMLKIPIHSSLNCANEHAQLEMIVEIDKAKISGDTLGGVFEVVAKNVPVGLGSHISWDSKLDGRLAQAVMSIPAVKAVEIGEGVANAGRFGSQVHDEIFHDGDRFLRRSNRAGGLEGGITNGEDLRVRGHMKPISTLRTPVTSVDIETKTEQPAAFERSDITAVPAAGVIGEAMVAIVLADAMREKFGGDSIAEMKRNFDSYIAKLSEY